jgi:hypothetical protein
MASLNLTAEEQAWIVIGKQYGASVSGSGTAEQLIKQEILEDKSK